MAFLCPVRIKKHKRKGVPPRQLEAPLPGRITGSDSIDTLVRVGLEKEHGPRARMVVVHDFVPCVDDELAVKRGQEVHVLYQENDWLYVITTDGKEGFIPYTYCLPVERSVDDFVLPRSRKSYLTQSGYHVSDGHVRHEAQQNSNLATSNSKSMPDITCTNQRQQPVGQSQSEEAKSQNHRRSQSQDRCHGRSRESSGDRSSERVLNRSFNNISETTSLGSSDRQPLIYKSAPSTPNNSRSRQRKADVVHDYYNLIPQVTKTLTQTAHIVKNKQAHTSSSHKNLQQNVSSSTSHNQQMAAVQVHRSQEAVNTSTHGRQQKNSTSLFYQPGASSTLPRNFSASPSKQPFQRAHSVHISSPTSTQNSRPCHQRQNSLPVASTGTNQIDCQLFEKHSYGRYIVLFSYTHRQENDIEVQRGEFVELLNNDDPEWYWIRRTDRHEGFVPATFLCPAEGQADHARITSSAQISTSQPNSVQARLHRYSSQPNSMQVSSQQASNQPCYVQASINQSISQAQSKQANHHQSNAMQVNNHQSSSMQREHQHPNSAYRNHQSNSIHANHQQPNSIQANSHQPNSVQANSHQLNSIEANSHQPNSTQANHHQPNSIHRNHQQSNSIQPNSVQASHYQPNSVPVTLQHLSSPPGSVQVSPRRSPLHPPFTMERATKLVCLYDFKAQAPDDLSVSRGQWLYADLDNQHDPEWLWVFSTKSQRTGYIPRTYAKPPNFGSISAGVTDPYVSP